MDSRYFDDKIESNNNRHQDKRNVVDDQLEKYSTIATLNVAQYLNKTRNSYDRKVSSIWDGITASSKSIINSGVAYSNSWDEQVI